MNKLTTTGTQKMDRRELLKTGLMAATALPLAHSQIVAAESGKPSDSFVIEDIKRTTVKIPYRDVPRRAMDRELPHWRYTEILEVGLRSGQTGIGETLLYYTWGATSDEDVERALGKNAGDLLWDDSLGAGLQMALFDAVAKSIEVPIYRLMGNLRNDRTPLSWWNIDTHPEDMASECALAAKQGYTAYKTKGRPWFDLWEQIEQSSQVVPETFKIDMDFNSTLRDAQRAIPILKELESNPRIDIYETPIPQSDIAGNRAICEATRVSVAHHYGSPPAKIAIRERVCDGFVVGGGACGLLRKAAVCEMADLPFWLQLVGTGITAAFSLHFGAVCSHAKWPAVNCHQLYQHDLLKTPIKVRDGYADIPQKPGLGYELDRKAVNEFAVEKPPSRPEPKRLLRTKWPDGKELYVANNGKVNFMLTLGNQERMPFFKRGVTTDQIPNDGSAAWQRRYERARQAPFFE